MNAAPKSAAREQLIEEYRALARKPGMVAGKHGDAEAALASAGKVIEAEYIFPYLAHAPMEPLDGYLRLDGDECARAVRQPVPDIRHRRRSPGVLGVKPEQVQIETMLAGGSFGRRAQTTSHFAAELAAVAKAIGPAGR